MGFLTSSKKLSIQSQADVDTVMSSIMEGVKPDTVSRMLARNLSFDGEIVGSCDGTLIKLEHKTNSRNTLRPTMEIRVSETSEGTLVEAHYSNPLYVRVFVTLFSITASLVSLYIATTVQLFPAVLLPFFMIFVVILMRMFAQFDQLVLEQFLSSRVGNALGR